ncbi:MAG: DUF1566 domain-containing protein, partial [Nitrospirae bacterium]|nr:DUF1566 domain-containing protein [Nitrospirota bacterium]
LTLGGNTDWRLPNVKELESLTDDTKYYPAIDTTFFPGVYASFYWSSTAFAYYPYYAWHVSFYSGNVEYGYKNYYGSYVRCVRGGQSGSFDYFCDDDNDGYIDSSIDGTCAGDGCVPSGCQTSPGDDCDDSNPAVYPGADDSQCDGIDNNCDGVADDGYVPTPTTCGVGVCESTGQLICVNGVTQDTCVPGTPQTEGPPSDPTCSDGKDNDCNGFTDALDPACIPIVSVTLVPNSTTVPRGGTLGYTVTVTNSTSTSQTFKYWTYVKLPNGTRYPPSGELFGPVSVTLTAEQTKSAHLSHKIPTSAPLGTYTYYGSVGPYPALWDSDSFNFTVTATLSPAGETRKGWELLENGLTK